MFLSPYFTARLLLRPSHPELAPAVSAYLRRNHVFLAPFEPLRPLGYEDEEQQRTLLEQDVLACSSGTALRLWLSLASAPQQVIGSVHLSNIVYGPFCSCYLGYRLDEAHQCQGFMTEALEQVVKIAFGPLGLHRIEANIMPCNHASLRVVQKLGFQAEGISPQYLAIRGKWEDHIHMVLLNQAMAAPVG